MDKEKFNFVGYELKVYIMKKLIVLLAIMSLGLSGCQMQEFDVVVTDSKDTFTASVEVLDSPTKTAMTPDRNVVWSAEDRVAIFRKSTLADEYVVSAASVGKTSAVLEPVVMNYPGTGDFYAGMEIPCNIAYYPYSGDLTVSGVSLKEENTSNVNSYRISDILLPRIQEYSPKTFSNGCFPMVAITESASDTDLKFRNLLGVLKLQLTGTQSVQYIELMGNAREGLSGRAEVQVFTDGQNPLAYSSEPSVLLHCGEGVQLDEHQVTEFMIALPPTYFSKGFTALVTDMEGNVYKLYTEVANLVDRSQILAMPPVSLEDIKPNVDDTYGTDEAEYLQGLTSIYNQFVTNSTQDLHVVDGGASELVRALWSIQEITADGVKCAWVGDAWVNDLNNCTWKGGVLNDAVYAVYMRILHGITYVNDYLRHTSDANLDHRGVPADVKAKVQQFRAEARFLRAYFYWVAMDTFGLFPFTTETSSPESRYYPAQLPRRELFDFIEMELRALSDDSSAMPAARSNYPRADKGSVLGLLARLYLNAEVYTGNPRWHEAREICERIFALGYALAPTHAELFRGDNGQNQDAMNEMLFAVAYDSEMAQSYGGTTYITFASLSFEDDYLRLTGTNNAWGGNRVPYGYVQKWFQDVSDPNYQTGTFRHTDKRADYFHIKGRTESMEYALNSFLNGWSLVKYSNIPHDMDPDQYVNIAAYKNFSDIDFPLIRLGEIYLIYAEACCRLGDNMRAVEKLASLSQRAGVGQVADVTLDYILAERSRELMWEGHRRTDLIRFGKWTSGYDWTYKGGVFHGVDLPSHYDLFPIPTDELAKNPNLMQNPGY